MPIVSVLAAYLSHPAFLVAGAVCAAIPIIIHLLNRQRYRTIPWAAMEFLRKALARNRRIMRLRDLLLMLVRTAAVALFGLALAGVTCTPISRQLDGSRPIHAVVIVDNTLPMGWQTPLTGNVLELAKAQATAFLETLPDGSRVSVVPLRDVNGRAAADAIAPTEAAERIAVIEVVDAFAPMQRAVALAEEAIARGPDGLTPQVVVFSDHRSEAWQGLEDAGSLGSLDNLTAVSVLPPDLARRENAFVESVTLPEGGADTTAPVNIVATIGYDGVTIRPNVEVRLEVAGVLAASRWIDLTPETPTVTVTFPHRFDAAASEALRSGVTEVPIRVAITPDDLPGDDERFLVVPVVSRLPVAFVDALGRREDIALGLVGETHALRRLLFPSRLYAGEIDMTVRHFAADEVTRADLAEMRLVVVAGVPSPGTLAEILDEFVAQGGHVLLATGGEFDPTAWTTAAWRDGAGWLPIPLDGTPFGRTPDEATTNLTAFQIDPTSLTDPLFELPDVSDEERTDLLREPYIFKTVVPAGTLGGRPGPPGAIPTESPAGAVEQAGLESDETAFRQRLIEQFVTDVIGRQTARSGTDGRNGQATAGTALRAEDSTANEGTATDGTLDTPSFETTFGDGQTRWLMWSAPRRRSAWQDAVESAVSELADSLTLETSDPARRRLVQEWLTARGGASHPAIRGRLPNVLARYENGLPMLVERALPGGGQVVLCTTGVRSNWNTLPLTNAFLVFDRIVRRRLRDTFPNFNAEQPERIVLPLRADQAREAFLLTRPGEAAPQTVETTFLAGRQRGVVIEAPTQRGIYRLAAANGPDAAIATPSSDSAAGDRDGRAGSSAVAPVAAGTDLMRLAVNGSARASRVGTMTGADFSERFPLAGDGPAVTFIPPGQPIRLGDSSGEPGGLWWYVMLGVFALLAAEMGLWLLGRLRFRPAVGPGSVIPGSAFASRVAT